MIQSAAQNLHATIQPPIGGFPSPRLVSDGAKDGSKPCCSDAVELSDAARQQLDAAETGGIREGLVQRVKGEIAAGTYLTDEKLDAVIDRLHRELFTD